MTGVCRIEVCPDQRTATIRSQALTQRGYAVKIATGDADLITSTVAAAAGSEAPVPSDDAPQTVTGPYIVLAVRDH